MMHSGQLLYFCGKMGAGKSTLSKQLAAERNAVRISEDEWLNALYPQQINTFDDYIHYAARVRPLMKQHVINLLKTGAVVVIDFPANTQKQRNWFKQLSQQTNASCQLYYLKSNDELCINRLAKRRIEQPERAQFDTEAVFKAVTQYFEPPTKNEMINAQIIAQHS